MNSISKSSAGLETEDESPEESSWTMYFEDFSNKNNVTDDMNENSSILSDINHQTSSVVSGAAFFAAGRRGFGASLDPKSCNSLSFKKRKIRGSAVGLIDEDLEDTASSPAHSPKVCTLVNHFDKNKKQKDAMDISQEIKGSGSGKINERNDELGFIGGENGGSEVKERGLCLAPICLW